MPAHGQFTAYVSERGSLVLTNEDAAPARGPSHAAEAPAADTPEPPAQPAPGGPAPAATPEVLDRLVQETALRHNVDPALVRAVIKAESNWNVSAVSRKGAMGLMQLIPATARDLGVRNAFDPRQNVDGGVRYLRMMLERYNGDLHKALAAYNAGPGAVDRFGGVPSYRETREYVRKVTAHYFEPDSQRSPRAYSAPQPIYRVTRADGRVVFTNE